MRAVNQQRTSSVLSVVFPLLAFFLFSIFTGLPEMVGFLHALRPILLIGAVGLIALAVTGRFTQVLQSRTGKVLTAFTAWFIICIPFAIWRGGSFQTFVSEWSKSYLAFFLAAGLTTTVSQMKKAFHTIAYAVGVLALLAIRFHAVTPDGRLAMGGGRYANSNELGFALLIGLPFIGFLYLQGNTLRKVLAVLMCIPVLIAIARTGSRASVLGAGMLMLIVFFQSSRAVRARLVVGVPVAFVILLLIVPAKLRDRYTTLFNPKDSQHVTDIEVDAVNSTESRVQLLKDSLKLTVTHPVFGVGPGNFAVAQNNLAIQGGAVKGLWHVTHNTYTQLSSEMGLPGLLIYLAFLYQSWRILKSITSKRKGVFSPEVRLMGETLRAAFLVLLTVAIFDSYAYNINIPTLAGLITALSFIAVNDRRARAQQAESIATPAPSELPEPAFEPAWSER